MNEEYQLLWAIEQVGITDFDIYCSLFHTSRTCRIFVNKYRCYNSGLSGHMFWPYCKICNHTDEFHYSFAYICANGIFQTHWPGGYVLYIMPTLLLLPSIRKLALGKISTLDISTAPDIFDLLFKCKVNPNTRDTFKTILKLYRSRLFTKNLQAVSKPYKYVWDEIRCKARKSAWAAFFHNKTIAKINATLSSNQWDTDVKLNVLANTYSRRKKIKSQ